MKVLKFILFSFMILSTLEANPRFAVENGAACSLCHVNPTGGGLRNDYGTTIFALEELPLKGLTHLNNANWTGTVGEHIRVGGDLRVQSLLLAPNDSKLRMPLFPMQATAYFNIALSHNLNLYYKHELSNPSASEYWLLIENQSGTSWLKAGKSLPDFGIKIEDHSAFIRGGNLRLSNGLSREGLFFAPPPYHSLPGMVELGTTPARDWRFTTSISNGYAVGTEAGYGFSEPVGHKALTTKLSFFHTVAENHGVNLNVSTISEGDVRGLGVSGGISLGGLTWLFETDRIQNLDPGATAFAVYHKVSAKIEQGFFGTAQYEFFDPDLHLLNGALQRFTLGTEVYFTNALGLIIEVRLTEIETKSVAHSNPEVLVQLHSWF